MKKKIILIIALLLIVTGCTKINDLNYNDIISSVVTSKYNLANQFRTGYKYYLPNGMSSIDSKDFNETLSSGDIKYYLYVDVVSYYNRVVEEYQTDENAYYSNKINYEDKYGYLEVNKQDNNKYFIEIMYNYAKIELIVDENKINEGITNAIIILTCMDYNNNVLANIVGDNVLQFNEEEFNIFQAKKQESDFLDVESNNVYDNSSDVKPDDPDLIN